MTEEDKMVFAAEERLAQMIASMKSFKDATRGDCLKLAKRIAEGVTAEMPLPDDDFEELLHGLFLPMVLACRTLYRLCSKIHEGDPQ